MAGRETVDALAVMAASGQGVDRPSVPMTFWSVFIDLAASSRGTSQEFFILDKSAVVRSGYSSTASESGAYSDFPMTASRYLLSSGRGNFCWLKVPSRDVRWFSMRFLEKILCPRLADIYI